MFKLIVHWRSTTSSLTGSKRIELDKEDVMNMNIISWEANVLGMVTDTLPIEERIVSTATMLIKSNKD